jgi:hypothetical protein
MDWERGMGNLDTLPVLELIRIMSGAMREEETS